MVLIINCRKPPSGQNLVVYVPIPKNTPDKMLPLLLTPNDIKIVSYLRKHGKAKEDKKGTTISYSGLTTYIPKRKLFIIIPYGLITPTAVKVLSCTYYRTKRK
jgi:hypothetical protein